MVRKLNENYGISDMIYQVLDGHYLSSSGGILESTIQDEVWEKVKEKFSNEITNKRRTVTAIVWSAFIDVINYYGNEEFGRGYGWKMDQKAVQRWFKRNGVDYKEVLKPVVDSVEELRKERLNKKESVTMVKRVNEAVSPEKANVRKVCDYMDWNMPTFCDRGAHGYICKWGGRSMVSRKGIDEANKVIDEIEKGTGIKCSLTRSGKLIIPYAKAEDVQESFITTDDGDILELEDPTNEIIDQFRNDMYNAIANVMFNYRDYDISADELHRLVDRFYRGY
jgi:hypothetical protein